MATFDPRRLLMFAVRVLKVHHTNPVVGKRTVQKKGGRKYNRRGNVRKAGVGIRDLLGEKQAVARDGPNGIEIRLGEFSRGAQAGEGREGHGNLIRFQI